MASLAIAVMVSARAASAQSATLRFQPPKLMLESGESALVEVVVTGIPEPGLAAFQFEIHFDPDVVRLQNPNEAFRGAGIPAFVPLGGSPLCAAVRGTEACSDPTWFLTSSGRIAIGTDEVDNEAGRILVAYATHGEEEPPTGSGTVALVEVVAQTSAATVLTFRDVILADADEPPRRFEVEIHDGYVNGEPPTPTRTIGDLNSPTPTPTMTAMSTPPNTATAPAGSTPSRTRTPSATPSPTATTDCAPDCNTDGFVDAEDVLIGIDIALARTLRESCDAFDADEDGEVTVEEIVLVVRRGPSCQVRF